jgi:hypothetical protein
VRRALSYAIDRGEILRTLRAGYGQLAVGPIGPYHWAFDSTIAPLPFSPDSARALLAQAGITDRNGDGRLDLPDGRTFTIELEFPGASVVNRDIAQVIDADLEELGVRLEQRSVDYNAMIQRVISPERDFDAFITSFENDFRINLRDLFHSGACAGALPVRRLPQPEGGFPDRPDHAAAAAGTGKAALRRAPADNARGAALGIPLLRPGAGAPLGAGAGRGDGCAWRVGECRSLVAHRWRSYASTGGTW